MIRIYGKVLGKPRPRVKTVRGRAYAYTDKKFIDYERHIKSEYVRQGGCMHHGAVRLEVDVCRKLPKSVPKKIKQQDDVFKPDGDNVLKIVMDALNGVAYEDDRFVVEASITKHPRTRIEEEYLEVTVQDA